jgi:Flp pilus assembly protein TadD/4-amino-4-deoxy-L-arabinose transferase-like glycosyltransferase
MARKTKRRALTAKTSGAAESESSAQVSPAGENPRWLCPVILIIFVIVFSLVTITSLVRKSATVDEPLHLLAGYSYLKWGDYRANPEHPPLAKLWAALPLLALEIKDTRRSNLHWDLISEFSPHSLHIDAVAADMLFGHNDAERLFFLARLMIVIVAVVLGLMIFRWSRELFGIEAAIAALLLYGLDPNILAHSQVVHTDIAFAATFFIGTYFYWHALEKLNWANLGLTALFFGLASITKYSYPVLLITWTLLGLAKVFSSTLQVSAPVPDAANGRLTKFKNIALILVCSLASAYLLIWCAYGFRFDALPGGADHLPLAAEMPENPVLQSVVSFITRYRVFPEAWIYGQLYVLKNLHREAYLLGAYSGNGFWLYFPVAFAVKTPLPTLILFAAAIALFMTKREDRFAKMFLLIAVAAYFSFAILTRINIGLRHILPLYPFLFVLAGGAAAELWRDRTRLKRGGLMFLGLWSLLSGAGSYPHFLAYFNALAGGSSNGHKFLLDSNLDWGQDLKELKRWLDSNGVKKIQFLYFGFHDAAAPRYYGIDAQFLPGSWVGNEAIPASVSAPADYLAISANHLYGGFFVRGERREDFVRVFHTMKPEVVIGYSIYVYRISQAIAELRRRAESNPAAAENYADLGSLLDNQGRREEAEQFYRRAVALDANSTTGNYNLGIILAKRGQLSEAITHFRQAAQASPKDPDIRYDLAVVLALNGELNEAVEQFWATLKIHPNYTKAHYNLGVTLAKLGDTAGAIEQLRDTLNIDTMYSKAYYQLGVLLAQQGETAEAISHFRRALQIQAEYAEAHDRLGRLLAARGQREEAVKHLEAAVRILKARQTAPTTP